MKSNFCNWSDVRVFLAVVREGSTLAASKTLGMAQPTVARRIEALEHALQTPLFERDTRGFRPTQAAQSLLPHAEAMEVEATQLAQTARALSAPRPIRITAFGSNFSPRVTEIFTAFSDRYPEAVFEFLPGVEVLDLMAGEADIALRITRTPPHPDLICRKISTARFTLYGTPAYPLVDRLPRGPDEFGGHRFVTFRRDGISSALHDWIAERVTPDQIVQTFSEFQLMIAAAKAGRGLAVMNVRHAESEGGFIQCFDPPSDTDADHIMLISPDAYRRPDVKTFVRFFAPRYAAIFR